MTLEECIDYAEEQSKWMSKYAMIDIYKERSEYYQDLAEWLRELNEIKHLFNITEKLFRANSRGGLIDVVDGYDILFSEHKQLREIFEEVNADKEGSDKE